MNPSTDVAQAMVDELLLARAARGDREAFVALASLHAARVFAIARNLCSGDVEALELAQGALQRAWDEIATLPAAGLSFLAFVSRFVVREAVPRLRRASAGGSGRLFTPLDADSRHLELGRPASPAAVKRIPDLDEKIRGAAEQLEPEDRAAFVLRVVEEIPEKEAAAILEMPPSVLRRRAHEACLLLTGYVQHLAAASQEALPAWIQ